MQNQRIIEYAGLEWTRQHHRVQLLALHWIPQESHNLPEITVQTLLELR